MSGSVQVTVKLNLGPLVDRWGALAVEAATEELQAQGDRIVADARKKWPVKTGRSRDGLLDTTVFILGTRVQVRILDAVPYAGYVKIAGTGGVLAWDRYVLDPVAALKAGQLSKAVIARIREKLQRRAA